MKSSFIDKTNVEGTCTYYICLPSVPTIYATENKKNNNTILMFTEYHNLNPLLITQPSKCT